jgi:hypothetical protein
MFCCRCNDFVPPSISARRELAEISLLGPLDGVDLWVTRKSNVSLLFRHLFVVSSAMTTLYLVLDFYLTPTIFRIPI